MHIIALSIVLQGPVMIPLSGSVAERSKALVLGTSLFGGAGSNTAAATDNFVSA